MRGCMVYMDLVQEPLIVIVFLERASGSIFSIPLVSLAGVYYKRRCDIHLQWKGYAAIILLGPTAEAANKISFT